ncbi:hypothetical protein F5887DRAFT_970801 [Amanita rubescens]|nr:hypothetical protein F5887DRAFT_970801 [Amanita rubescens]
MTGDGANDTRALSRADVGIAVEGAPDAAHVVLTEPDLSTIVHGYYSSRTVFVVFNTLPVVQLLLS